MLTVAIYTEPPTGTGLQYSTVVVVLRVVEHFNLSKAPTPARETSLCRWDGMLALEKFFNSCHGKSLQRIKVCMGQLPSLGLADGLLTYDGGI
jgi:hypothetical protein